MKDFFEKLLRRRAVSIVCGASALLILAGWIWAYFALRHITQPLILHFNRYDHINQIGDLADVAHIAFFGLLVTAANSAVALVLEARDWFWGKLVAAATAFFAILLFIFFVVIISVN